MTDTGRYNDCADVREQLSAYFDGELSPEDREAMDAHLRDCAECLRELNALKQVDDAYAKLGPAAAPEDFNARVQQAVKGGKTAEFPRRRGVPHWAGPLVAVAAAATVVFTGVVLLEWQQGDRTDLAMAPAQSTALEKTESDATSAAGATPSGAWESFTATTPADQVGAPRADAAPDDARGQWSDFVGQNEVGAKEKQSVGGVAGGGRSPEEEFNGRADERELRQGVASPAPVAADSPPPDDDVADRAAVLGEPPSTLPAPRAEALKDAANESERNRTEARAQLDSQANRAAAAGEVVQRSILRSFRVGADGIWYESGYNGEAATPIERGSDALRELMKRYPSFDWNKLLDRRARQVFQLDEAWYDLEAAPEQE